MDYISLKITAKHEELDLLTMELMEMGITATEIIDNTVVDEVMDKKNDFEWDYIEPSLTNADREIDPQICVYFENTEEGLAQMNLVLAAYKDRDIERGDVHEEDWVNSYKAQFKTLPLTEHLVVHPSWEDEETVRAEYGADKKMLVLDPGMAFGTGSHETTSLCATLLDKTDCVGKSVLDIGTGSGILALAAAVSGANPVLGVDIDPVAVEVARENVVINKCADAVEIREGDLVEGIDFAADIVVANLMAELVCMLAPHVPKHMKEGGVFISSGILTEKKDMVTEAIEKAGMTVVDSLEKGEWCALLAK